MNEKRITTPMDLVARLRARGWTLGLAESCTGGKLSSMITENAGVSDVFMGSVVSYANGVKTGLLGVRPETLQRFGAVSEVTAGEMAAGARTALGADVAVAITGIAGPGGGSVEKPVGLVCFAANGPGFALATTRNFGGDRVSIQRQSADFALEFLRLAVEGAATEK